MKKVSITFSVTLDVCFDDRYDPDWIADRYLSSGRFGIDRVGKDPDCARILAASFGVEEVRLLKGD